MVDSGELPPVRCRWCRAAIPAEAKRCAHCGRALDGPSLGRSSVKQRSPTRLGALDRRGGASSPLPADDSPTEPLPSALGQEPFGSWANIKVIMRHDRLFGALLVLLAANVVLQVVGQRWFDAFVSGVILWGIVTFRWWGYWFAMVFAGLGLVGVLIVMMAAGGAGLVGGLIPLALDGFVLFVLYTRRDCFD